MYGDGSNAVTNRTSNATSAYWGATASGSEFGINTMDLMNYGNATTYKTMLVRQGESANASAGYVYSWRKTPEAITSISFISATGSATIAAGSTITLYGIQAA
jgi:hypothetical protein